MAGYDDLLAAVAPTPAPGGKYDDLIQATQTGKGHYSDLIDAVAPPPPPSTTPATDAAATYGSSGPTTAEGVVMEQQFKAAHPSLYGVARGVAGMIPTPEQVMQAGAEVNKASEHPIESLAALPGDITKNATQMGKAARGDYGPEAQAQTITQAALMAAPLLHLPFAKGKRGTIVTREELAQEAQKAKAIADMKAEAEMANNPANYPAGTAQNPVVMPENFQGVAGPTVESTTTASGDVTPVAQPGLPPEEVLPPDQTNVPTDTGAEAANLEVGQNGQGGVPPEYTPQMGFPAPAVEGEVRPPAKVTQAITLEEIRLMREKADLELQAHISQRATGQTHPAIELRIEEIDQELQDIVNQELGQQPPRVIPETGAAEPAAANLEVGQQERPLTKSELRASRKPEQGGGEPSARSKSEAAQLPIQPLREGVGDQTSYGQQGETADVPPQGGDVRGSQPEQAPETPVVGGANVDVQAQRPIEPPEPGAAVGWEENTRQGHQWLDNGGNVNPIIQRFRASGKVSVPEMGRMRAMQERIQAVTNVAGDALRKSPDNPVLKSNYEQAVAKEQAFAEAFKPMHTVASNQLRSLQGKIPLTEDMAASYTGLKRQFEENAPGKFGKEESIKADKISKDVQSKNGDYAKANEELYKAADTEYSRIRTKRKGPPTLDDIGKTFGKTLTEVCDV